MLSTKSEDDSRWHRWVIERKNKAFLFVMDCSVIDCFIWAHKNIKRSQGWWQKNDKDGDNITYISTIIV